jgi:hypothetical protein
MAGQPRLTTPRTLRGPGPGRRAADVAAPLINAFRHGVIPGLGQVKRVHDRHHRHHGAAGAGVLPVDRGRAAVIDLVWVNEDALIRQIVQAVQQRLLVRGLVLEREIR